MSKRVLIKTAHSAEGDLLSGILDLYNDGSGVDVDPCYSKGRVWKQCGVEPPTRKYDIAPVLRDVEQCDCRHLPLGDASVGSVFFDPPFLPVGKTRNGAMCSRFSGFDTLRDMYDMYEQSLCEFKRCLRESGLLIWKCQDIVHHDRQELVHVWIINKAVTFGFTVLDIFVLLNNARLTSSKWQRQVHARKNHCFYLVLSKGDKRK